MSTGALLARIGFLHPIVQAPMAGVSTSAMTAAVCEAGALGSIAVGAMDATAARRAIDDVRALTSRPFNVNVFCHRPAIADAAREAAWIARVAPLFARFDATPPTRLTEIYRSFVVDDAMQALLIESMPAVVSFHFGLPSPACIAALKAAGIVLFASATNLAEAKAAVDAGVDAIVAQGIEAGGHRGVFDPAADDVELGTLALVRVLVKAIDRPVIAAGGIMDGAGIAAVLRLGAVAAQLGTAFIACHESIADAGFRAALASDAAHRTVLTPAISGRRARCLANAFTSWGAGVPDAAIPSYPIAYDAGKALHAAAKAKGEFGYGAQWAGQGAPLCRSMSTTRLMEALIGELRDAG
jgi:nitronate monooxygenase